MPDVISTSSGPFGLAVGRRPDFVPRLQICDGGTRDVALQYESPQTLFVTDEHNLPALADLRHVVCVQNGSPEQVHAILETPGFADFERVVGVGGCLALDVAKAVAVGLSGSALVAIPTILSTNCITKNRSVIGEGLQAQSYRTTAPQEVDVPMGELMAQDDGVRGHWAQSGWGDFFAKISAMLDQFSERGEPATHQGLRDLDPTVMDGLDWVKEHFDGHSRDSMGRLAANIHDAGLRVIAADRNDTSVGGEHKFYKAMMDLYPHLRHQPAHGQVVAVGTLITVAAYASEHKASAALYADVRNAFERLGLPVSWTQLEELGIGRPELEASLTRITRADVPRSCLGDYFRTHDFRLLDKVFGDEAAPTGTYILADGARR